MLSFIITVIVLFGLLIGIVIYYVNKHATKKQKLVYIKGKNELYKKANKVRRSINRLTPDNIRKQLHKWKK